jgi:hypothetical protein
MIDIDKIDNWQDCLQFPTGKIIDLNSGKIYNFTFVAVKSAFEYWNRDFKDDRLSMNGTNEAKDRSNKHFYSKAGMVLAYLNRSGTPKYQLYID